MSQQTILIEAHQNHYLFSDHYLNDILPKLDVWDDTENFIQAKDTIYKLYFKIRTDLSHSNEAQLERDFIQPVLKILEHFFEIQAPLYGSQMIRPDYTFFHSDEERKEVKKLQGRKEYFEHAIAIGDAKSWERSLDRRIKKRKGIDDPANPSVQINNYLMATSQKWGLLTNGRLWRLYNKDTSYSLDRFYQIDLVKLIEQDDTEAFKYFYLFFRCQAFELYDTQPTFLDFVYNQSESYKVELEKDVKTRIYEALRILANGFLKYHKNNLDPIRDKQTIQNNCLILLYRMLFVFYAEARKLLPDNQDYKINFSFDTLKRKIHERKKSGENISPVTTEYWGKLQALFMLLNDPQGLYDMPQYNGGLFNPNNYPFLEKYQIGDQAMAEAFDLIACARTKDDFGFVDYRTLEVQHLGSIYEGLLEYKLEIADQDKVVVKKGKKQEIIADKADYADLPVAYQKGEYYLVTDKGERKATGSYYTPDYIVRYIVENTIQPLVDRCKKYEQILELNVLDPAMGSGHFLVGVVNFLAEQILYHPTTPLLEEGEEEKEIAHWRRRVVERCVYGVDLNPLAVELAKLSLWLHTVAYGKPLSFLDHHLRCGNSLIGARVKDLYDLPDTRKKKKKVPKEAGKQITTIEPLILQKASLAVRNYLDIELAETLSKQDVDKKEYLLKIGEAHLKQFKELANVWVSAYFGNELTKEDYHTLLEALQESRFTEMNEKPFFKNAQQLADEKSFFHWEMEFPDVFFDNYGRWLDNPGFDGVVGNPPYIQLSMDEYLRKTYQNILIDLYGSSMGRLNTFGFFIKLAIEINRNNCISSMIVPNTFLTMTYYKELRMYILENMQIDRILLFEELPFEEAIVENVVCVLKKVKPKETHNIIVENAISISGYIDYNKKEIFQSFYRNLYDCTFNVYLDDNSVRIKKKMDKESTPMWKIAEINQAIALKHDRAKYLFNEKKNENFKPVLDGRDINRYSLINPGNFLKYEIEAIHSCKKEDIFLSSEKLFFRRVGERIIATYDNNKYYALNTLVVINLKPKVRVNLKYILAIFNSKLINWYFQKFLKSTKDIFSEIQARQVEQLPILISNEFSVTGTESENIKEIITKYDNGDYNSILRLINTGENSSYRMIHNFLSILAGRMIKMNNMKTEIVRNYKEWLTDYIGIDKNILGTLSIEFFNYSIEEYIGQISQRKIKITVNQTAEIKAQFEQSVSNLKPLIACIEKTDWLIDQIVYRLYGLTEEEILVVEESIRR